LAKTYRKTSQDVVETSLRSRKAWTMTTAVMSP
jgi:hypothetical protein